jgi:hypothetical protein
MRKWIVEDRQATQVTISGSKCGLAHPCVLAGHGTPDTFSFLKDVLEYRFRSRGVGGVGIDRRQAVPNELGIPNVTS